MCDNIRIHYVEACEQQGRYAVWRSGKIISGMIGSTLYLVGINIRNGEYKENTIPCTLCKRMIINAGIKTVVVRDSKTEYRVIEVSSWIENDDTLED